jgi:hypothetical protein
MQSRVIIVVLATLSFAPAAAQDMPRFAVEAHCRQIASFGGSYSASLYGSCMDMEQTAYDNLKGLWGRLPANMRRHCQQIAAVAGSGSYSLLESCIQMETSAGERNRSRQFRY